MECENNPENYQNRYYQTRRAGVSVVETDPELGRLAGLEKCGEQRGFSLADCYALGLARKLGATILTTDGALARAQGVRTVHFQV